MKVKYGNLENHRNAITTRYSKIEVKYKEKEIVSCLVVFDKVKKIWSVPRENAKEDTILADGYKWLQIYGLEESAVVSVVYTDKNEFVETYFDIAKEIFKKEEVPYAYDLYLDVVQTNKGKFLVLDKNELEEALENKDITKDDYKLAIKTSKEIMETYKTKEAFEEFKKFADSCLDKCLEKLI